MGHLINATALRVGWFSNWTDSWFSEHVYYPEFLFLVFRIRLFLVYFFQSKRLEKAAYFYSHFEIIYKYNNILINIFIYDGAVEGIMDELFVEHLVEVNRFNHKHKQKKTRVFYDAWKILVVLNWMHGFSFYKWPSHKLDSLLYSLKMLQLPSLQFLLGASSAYLRGNAARSFFFLHLFLNLRAIVSKNFVKNATGINTVLSRFIYIMAWSLWNNAVFQSFRAFLLFIFEKILTKFTKINISFFSLTGYSVNAKFLSRFLARKLKQGYSVKELLNPIKKELGYVSFITRYPLSNYFFLMNKQEFNKAQVLEYRKSIFKYLLVFLFSLYSKYYFSFYKHTSSWLYFDIIIAARLILKSTIQEKFSKIYLRNRAGLGFLFFSGQTFLGVNFFNLFIGNSKVKLHRKLDFYVYIDSLFNDFYANFDFFFKSTLALSQDLSFFCSNIQLNNLVTQHYWTYNYNYLYAALNKRKLREFTFGRFGYLIGFKLHCLGRFSRKERASSLWYRQVKVPLNTLSAVIDFGYFTVPLRNSSATVKLWLYRKSNYTNFYFKLV